MKSNSSPSAPAKSLKPVFRENTEIQAFSLLRKNSFNCNFAVVCAVKTGEMNTMKGIITIQTFQLLKANKIQLCRNLMQQFQLMIS